MRNMFYTVTVASAEPIDGCDKIHYIGFEENGYKVIASKEIKIGDVVAYGEVDSIFPESDKRFEFLKARCYKESLNGYLIKAMKMRGLRSFGIVFTFNELGIKPVKAGTDLTDKFNIGKYEPAEDASPKMQKTKGLKGLLFKFKITRPLAYKIFGVHKIKGEFPTHIISKSDEDNIQNHKEWFDKYKNEPCYISAKIEGCSVVVVAERNGKKIAYKVFGRNTIAQNCHFIFFEKLDMEKKLKNYLKNHKNEKSIAIQGEYCSPTVQKGPYKNGTNFYVYKINVSGKTVDLDTMKEFCNDFGLKTVPIIAEPYEGFGTIWNSVEEMQEYTEHLWFKPGEDIQVFEDKKSDMKGNYSRHEGIVVCSINKGNWSFKVKSQEYQIDGIGKIKSF